MSVFDKLIKFFSESANDEITHVAVEPLFEKYEVRKEEILSSEDVIEGIFYIIDGEIIPDYSTERLASSKLEKDSNMYHYIFYQKYILLKFNISATDYKSIARGRVEQAGNTTSLFIDFCYKDDEKIIDKIKEIYRIKDNYKIPQLSQYTCALCRV